jgi:eukaryotic-like serine/threonine-protein kinase
MFSFGSVLYEMVTGRRAFQGDSNMSTAAAVINQLPRLAGELAAELPREVDRVIERCRRKDPKRRWQHASDLRIAVEDLKAEIDSGTFASLPKMETLA